MHDFPPRKANVQDLRTHLQNLEQAGKLRRITRAICKDTELMPLVRWQFRGLPESERTGFLFENVVDAKGNRVAGSCAVGIYAASRDVYAIGMGCPTAEIRGRWLAAQANPLPPRLVDSGEVQEEVHVGDTLLAHGGLGEFPIPISTPGFDASPYTTASNWITKDPETGWTNTGNYRGQIKAPDRMSTLLADLNHGEQHWLLARKQGKPLEAALVIGGLPALTYAAGTRIPYGMEEYAVAGSLIGEPLEVVRCKTVDLTVPAHAEIVIEGYFSNEYLEPEGPFGEYTGYMGERGYAAVFQVTAITHRKNPIFTSIISQMPPSESSTLKKVGQDNAYLYYLRNQCGIPAVKDVRFHPIALDSWCIVQLSRCAHALVWQTLYAVAGRHNHVGKMIIAVDEDIDPDDFESVVWALSYRMLPSRDVVTLPNRCAGLDPSIVPPGEVVPHKAEMMLIDATRKWDYPPVSLPAKQYMERAKALWEELGLPTLAPRVPWHGYDLGNWTERDREEAAWAVEGEYYRAGERAKQDRRPIK
jgi:4-hydroxy-3-polyprenylbenzoate decarboxylase